MITDTCTWHTRLDTHAHTRYLYEHELGYSMEYAIGNTPSVHAAEPWRAPTCTESAPHLHRSGTSKVLAIASVLHVFRTKSAPEVPTLKSTGYHIELSPSTGVAERRRWRRVRNRKYSRTSEDKRWKEEIPCEMERLHVRGEHVGAARKFQGKRTPKVSHTDQGGAR